MAALREQAIALRLAGKSVREIKQAVGPVGKRTLSAALKGTPPAEWTLRPKAHAASGTARSWARVRERELYRRMEGWASAAMAA